jgi:hypothetical protein
MNFNNISDDTKLRVRVPKALYESIQKELKKKSLNENTTFYLVDKQNKVVDTVEAKDQEEAEKHFNNTFEGTISGYIVTDQDPENINEEYPEPGKRGPFTGEMPKSMETELQIKRIDSIITELRKIQEFLKK